MTFLLHIEVECPSTPGVLCGGQVDHHHSKGTSRLPGAAVGTSGSKSPHQEFSVLASLPDPPAPTPSRARRLEGALRQVVRLPAGPIDAALRGHAAMIVRSGFAVHRLALGPMGSTELLGPGDVVFGGTLDETASLPAQTGIEAIESVEITLLGPQLSDAIARDPSLGVSLLQAQQQRVDRARVVP